MTKNGTRCASRSTGLRPWLEISRAPPGRDGGVRRTRRGKRDTRQGQVRAYPDAPASGSNGERRTARTALLEPPLGAFLRVFQEDADFVQAFADGVGLGEVFGRAGVVAQVDEYLYKPTAHAGI